VSFETGFGVRRRANLDENLPFVPEFRADCLMRHARCAGDVGHRGGRVAFSGKRDQAAATTASCGDCPLVAGASGTSRSLTSRVIWPPPNDAALGS
jgi:hypothetical protein